MQYVAPELTGTREDGTALAKTTAPTTTVARIADQLTEARARTLLLVASLTEEDLRKQHDPLMGPIIWDLGHIAHFEELWLLGNLKGNIEFGEMPGMFNPFENPRGVRGSLALPTLPEMLAMLAETRSRVLQALQRADLASSNSLLRDAYVYRMVLQHEYQHNETMLQTLQLKQGDPYRAPRATAFSPPGISIEPGDMVRFPGGKVSIGTDDRSAAYDNERPMHEVDIAAFMIDRTAVTCAEYLDFVNDSGYTKKKYWTEAGWAWIEESGAVAPRYWTNDNGAWRVRTYDQIAEADADVPVCHVSWFEADAYARYAGKRLPTETEWEAAATFNTETGEKMVFPWGNESPTALHANVDQLAFKPAPVGTFARNVSPVGCYGMIGDVWEWTSTDFHPHPGFEMFPYPEYSSVFFGAEYKVLRGGSWATRPGAIRGTFRNWDYPIRRQIFSGFRCARDA